MRRGLKLILTLLIALNADSARAADPDTFKLGTILILSGEGASWGNASLNGAQMAVDELNAKGGVLGKKITLRAQDDQGDPKKTIAAFKQLTDSEDVHFIIGPNWGRNGIPLVEMIKQKKVLMISPTIGLAQFNESSPYIFNTYPHDYISSESLAQYVYSKGKRKVALIGAEEPWVKEQTIAFTRSFEKLGGQIGFLMEPIPDTKDVRTDALKVSKAGVDAVVSTTDGVLIGSLVAKSLRDIKSTLPIYSVTVDQAAIDAAQGGFEGMEFVSYLTPTAEFKSKYEARFKAPIDIGADSAYDAVMLLAQAIEKAGSLDTTKVAEALAAVKTYAGTSGNLVSDGKRGVTKPAVYKTVKDGKPIELLH